MIHIMIFIIAIKHVLIYAFFHIEIEHLVTLDCFVAFILIVFIETSLLPFIEKKDFDSEWKKCDLLSDWRTQSFEQPSRCLDS